MIIPVILSGGSGTRLWPLSRKLHPKQFLNLVDNNRTVFQNTLLRLPNNVSDPVVICNEEHRFLAAEQLREINVNPNSIILEPFAKNTAPAITLAALKLITNNEDPILLVLPADHIIQDIEAFHKSIKVAETLARKNKLVTFGIKPNKAEIDYGYIEVEITNQSAYHKIKSFKEKPNQDIAESYLNSGIHLWNSGMFMFKASIFLDELRKFEPKIYNSCKKSFKNIKQDVDFIRIDQNSFFHCPEKSLDYAVMEHTKNAMVVPFDANWIDIGSWKSLMDFQSKDTNGNVTEGDIVLDNVKNTYAYSSSRLITLSGVSDLIIIDTQDALLVINKNKIDDIKILINKLRGQNRSELDQHRKVYRPWGYYDLIDKGNGFQAKRILVQPGSKLSLQKHKYRAEHWVIVSGVATITCGDKTFHLKENKSTYIPKGEIHRLENKEKIALEIIEIQTGDYLSENDIIRLEDDYNRI